MACCLVALDKRIGVRPVGIGETLRMALAKLVTRAAGGQAMTACGNLQLCAGLEAGIEGSTHAVGERILERVQRQRSKEEVANELAEKEKESGGVTASLNNFTIQKTVTEEEAAEHLKEALGMEVEADRGSEGEEGGDGTQRSLEILEFITHDAEPSGTTLVDARNGFNKMSRLEMLWTVRHYWPAGARFAFNCYRHWAQLLLRQSGGVASYNPE